MSTPSKAANQRQRTWRAQAAQPEQRARRRNVFRVLLPALGIGLLGLLAWLLIAWFLRPPKLELLAIAVADYRNPEAPPIPYCYEDLEGLRKVLGQQGSEDSWNDASSDKFAQLGTALRETSNSHDNLLVYIKAHGISQNGAGYLLDGSFELRGRTGRLPIDDLLAQVAESPARVKLIVLDTGHLESDPRMGMLANEFTHLLTQAMANLPEKQNVWVLTSNSLFEQAQVSIKDRRSALGYYLAQGLNGAADGVLDQYEPDGLVQLDELYQYVRDHVTQYARLISSDLQTQTPLLLHTGEGEVAEVPHLDLLRIDRARQEEIKQAEQKAAEKKEVSLHRGPSTPVAQLPWSMPAGLALALAGNQQVPATRDDSGKATASKAAASTGAAEPAKENEKAAADANAAKDAKTGADKAEPPSADDNAKSKAEAANPATNDAGKKTIAPAAQPTKPRERGALEKSLFDRYTWLDEQQQRAELWRPADYAPDLTRLYYESLTGCRERALAGDLFLKVRAYQTSLSNKLGEVEDLQRQMNERSAVFVRGAARPSYERDSDAKAAIRVRNDACYLLPLMIADYHRASAKVQSTMKPELEGLTTATAELNRLLAQEPDQPTAAQWFENWRQSLRTVSRAVRGHLGKLRDDFASRCEEQKRLIVAEGNQAVAPRLVDLAEFPLASPEEREDLQALARKAARSFAEVERQGSASLRRPATTEKQRLSRLGWQRTIDRAQLELDLLALLVEDKPGGELEKLREKVAVSEALVDAAPRIALSRQIDKFVGDSYRDVPEQLREWLQSSRYQSWRRAETAIRLADARDQKTIGRIVEQRSSGSWSDPIAGVPLKALPERVERYQLALGEGSDTLGGPLALSYKVPQKLALRFESNEPISPERLRLKLAYNQERVQVKNAQGSALIPSRVWPIAAANSKPTREFRMDLEISSLDEKGQQTSLTLTWLDENDRELSQVSTALVHPEPVFSQLAVFGQPGTADHSWRKTPQGEWCFDVPFDNGGLGHAHLLTFSGHETRYDFRLTNNATNPKKYTVAIYSVPRADENDPARRVETMATAGETRGIELARNELTLASGATASVPFFPSQPPPAATPDAAKAADSKGGAAAAKEPAPNVTSGLVCVLTEQSTPPNATTSAAPRRQVVVVEVETQFPSNYITPRVNYDARTGEIAAVLTVPNVDRLPPGGSKVEIDVLTQEQLAQQPAIAKREAELTPANPQDTLRLFVRAATPTRAEVFLHVDGYPRAFVYELPLDASLPNVERRLLELRRIELPDASTFPVYRAGTVSEPVAFPVRFDLPPSRDRSFFARVFIDRQPEPGGEFNRLEDTLVLQSFSDRVHEARLLKPKDAPGIAVQTAVSDFVGAHAPPLNLAPYRNQAVHIRAQLLRREPGRDEVLSNRDGTDRADRELVIYLDGENPTVTVQGPNRSLFENEKFQIDVYARDEVTDVDKVEFAPKVQRDAASKDPDAKVLVEPKLLSRLPNGTFRLNYAFEKPGEQSLWFQATDKSGNKSEIQELNLSVRKRPEATAGGAAAPQVGQITGRVTFPEGGRGQIKTVILGDAAGKPVRSIPPSGDGRFVFDRLQPGDYTVDAKGVINNTESKPNPVPVRVEAGKTAGPVTVVLGR